MTMMNDTMDTVGSAMDSAKSAVGSAADTAKHTVDSAKKGTVHAASVAFSDITGGIRAITEAYSLIRNLGVNDALGWIGLSRRRSGFESFAIFGSGVLVGAGVGMLLAPMAGSDLRNAFITRIRGVEKDAEKVAGKVKDAVVNAEQKVEDAAGKAKDAVFGTAKGVVEGAEQKAGDLANKAKDAVDAVDRKADSLSDKAKDATATTERRNNNVPTEGHRDAARNSVTAK